MQRLLALVVALFPAAGAAQTIDYNIANQTFPAFRTDLNDHLSAIAQQNAGTVAPATTFPYMVWVDTSGATPIYKYRNAANAAWVTAFEIEAGASEWLGKVTSSNAVLTGGSIDGMTIGAVTPAAGTFTTATATRAEVTTTGNAVLQLRRSDDANTHDITTISREANELTFKTRTNVDVLVSTDYVMTIGATGASEHSWRIGNVERLEVRNTGNTWVLGELFTDGGGIASGGTISPRVTSAYNLGGTLSRWSTLYLVNAPNVSSDERLKSDIGDVAEAECRVADRIEIRRYRLNSDPSVWHFGAIAQEVIAAFDAEGLDWQDYAIVTGSEAETYGVAYDELQNLKLACL